MQVCTKHPHLPRYLFTTVDSCHYLYYLCGDKERSERYSNKKQTRQSEHIQNIKEEYLQMRICFVLFPRAAVF